MKASKGKFPLSTVALAIAAASTVFTAQAQEYTTEGKMVVVSSRTPKAISDIPGTVWYIDSEKIEQEYRGGKTLGDILASAIPSLDVSSGARTNLGQNLRGRKMLVMIDGVSLQSSRSISRHLDSIDPFNIDRIEVLSGSTSIYGAGASGGVINIITKKAQSEELEFESYVGGTSGLNSSEDFDYKLAQSISGGNEKVQARTSVVYTETQGFFDANGTIVTPDISQGSLQFNQTVDFLTTVGVNVSDTKKLNLLAQYYDSQQDSPYGLYIVGSDFVDVRKGFDSDREHGTERIMLSASYVDEQFLGHQLIAEASYRKEDQTYTPYFQSSGQQITDVISLKAALAKNFDKFNIVYGVDAYQDKLESNQALYDPTIANNSGNLINKTYAQVGRYPGVEVSSVAAFAQADYSITEDWTVEGGVRYQYMSNKIDDFVGYTQQKKIAAGSGTSADAVPGGKTDYGVALFNLGTIYHLNSDSQVWANFSQGFDLADPAKYYGQGNYTLVGDHWQLNDSINVNESKMSGIKTNSFELGYRLDTGDLNLQTAAYYSQSDKNVKYNKTTLLIEEIEDKKRVYGLEAMASYWVHDNIQLGASGHYVVSEVKGDNGWEDYDAGYASTSKANAWAGWYDADLAVKLQSQTMFDYEDASNNKLDGYTLFDLVGSYQLPVGSLGFGIQNLFDKDYTTAWGQRAQIIYSTHYESAAYDYKGRGRTYTLNYQVKF
ncbi:TonB-dependent receptor [Vibrio tubiashii]|uniref:TonB-dependent receptor n=1 Tax=Vibrio tubiashii TaxID=29498 RepID=A0AAE5LGM6_9VIBR|nr:TonB-dependent receptor [Vibrio tubiashii]MCG9581370.1 TonB-dependent receptor [Vibrio tubiashii]MCG9614961.1 TonB-dependent receptor [Vibrio tubiashii]MCG9688259.1 TonB-dependent receptor [Vibrio tubiashii]NOI79474.1 TonB-dependent receptor [Vibrio tubiashii]